MLKRKTGIIICILAVLILIAGCGRVRQEETADNAGTDRMMRPPAAPEPVILHSKEADNSVIIRPPDGGLPSQGKQRLIRNADVTLEVPALAAVLTNLEQLAREAGGLITNSSFSGLEQQRRASVTVRLPEAAFDGFLLEAEKLGKVVTRQTYTSDVTRQYIDLEARISNLQRQEQRLLSILEQAKTVKEILDIERELERVRGQLESLTGEFRYLRDQVEFATVNVHLTETPAASPVITGAGLRGVWRRGLLGLTASVNSLLAGLGSAVVFLLTAIPYLLILASAGVPAAVLVRRLYRRRKFAAPTPDK
ncbi:MAG: hypothetical protein DDT21_01989 [Syntrophomonadaceae bacterium]|nr:hypothetical protein [Bacillota bacterium]